MHGLKTSSVLFICVSSMRQKLANEQVWASINLLSIDVRVSLAHLIFGVLSVKTTCKWLLQLAASYCSFGPIRRTATFQRSIAIVARQSYTVLVRLSFTMLQVNCSEMLLEFFNIYPHGCTFLYILCWISVVQSLVASSRHTNHSFSPNPTFTQRAACTECSL